MGKISNHGEFSWAELFSDQNGKITAVGSYSELENNKHLMEVIKIHSENKQATNSQD